MTRSTAAAKDAHRDYMRAYMAERRLSNPKSHPDKMRAAFRQIIAILDGPAQNRPERIRLLCTEALNPPKTPIKDTGK